MTINEGIKSLQIDVALFCCWVFFKFNLGYGSRVGLQFWALFFSHFDTYEKKKAQVGGKLQRE